MPNPQGKNVYRIDFSKLPSPFLMSQLGAKKGEMMSKAIGDNLIYAQSILDRPLRQDEVDAISYHLAKSVAITSYGLPAGIVIGSAYAYRGMRDWTFPFWKPKEGSRFNPDRFGPLRGRLAQASWHGVRFNLYMFVSAIACTLFATTYATTVNAVATGTDRRLHDYIHAARAKQAEKAGQTIQRPVGQRNPISSQEGMMDRQAQGAARRLGMETQYSRQDVQRKPSDYYDDASPTGGAWLRDNDDASTDTGLLSDQQMQQRDTRQQPDAPDGPSVGQDNRANTFSMRKVTHQPDAFDGSDQAFSATDTSPSSTDNNPPSSGSGSAWERIRQNAAAGGPKQSARATQWPGPSPSSQQTQASIKREQSDGATLADSFSFSESDEERQLAKAEAQNDFDARVERERHGGDFSESARGGWRR